jgi:hypothetical protein
MAAKAMKTTRVCREDTGTTYRQRKKDYYGSMTSFG